MLDFKMMQASVFDVLQKKGARGFVRVCTQNDALWVSDCPRRTEDLSEAEKELSRLGICTRLDDEAGLWYLDLTDAAWTYMLNEISDEMPPLPEDECLHPAYALCRLWLLHADAEKALVEARTIWKFMNGPEEKMLAAIPLLHEAAACALREGRAVGYEAGKLLAGWLREKQEECRK